MRKLFFAFAACAAVTLAHAQAVPGQTAPAFSARDLAGKSVNLADYKGKWVVLEWTNPGCPFVQKHYDSGNMQALQKKYAGDGVAWLAINSTAPGTTDYLAAAALAAWVKQQGAAATTVLADEDGKVGRAYNARTTPQMFVIDPAGKIVYAGAIDDKRSANPADVKTATNYVAQALTEARAGKPVSVASTPPYGCSVKYQ
jgi:peroxiredoxin